MTLMGDPVMASLWPAGGFQAVCEEAAPLGASRGEELGLEGPPQLLEGVEAHYPEGELSRGRGSETRTAVASCTQAQGESSRVW